MRKLVIKVIMLSFILFMSTSRTAHAIQPIEITARDGSKHYMVVFAPDPEQEISMLQYGDMIGELPAISVYIDGKLMEGTITYSNYDNSRLGVWDLEWVFTPKDDNFEAIQGTMRLNVRPRDKEKLDEPTTPSLTATSVRLETKTTYDINLNNKVPGSKYKWTSSNTKVAKVNSKNGLVTAVAEGNAIVTCEIALPNGSVQILESIVTVGYDENAPMLTDSVLDLEIGDKYDINVENKIAKSKYRWVSSDRSIVRVNSANGKVTAVGKGKAYVTCTITTPENQVIVLKCDINITE